MSRVPHLSLLHRSGCPTSCGNPNSMVGVRACLTPPKRWSPMRLRKDRAQRTKPPRLWEYRRRSRPCPGLLPPQWGAPICLFRRSAVIVFFICIVKCSNTGGKLSAVCLAVGTQGRTEFVKDDALNFMKVKVSSGCQCVGPSRCTRENEASVFVCNGCRNRYVVCTQPSMEETSCSLQPPASNSIRNENVSSPWHTTSPNA